VGNRFLAAVAETVSEGRARAFRRGAVGNGSGEWTRRLILCPPSRNLAGAEKKVPGSRAVGRRITDRGAEKEVMASGRKPDLQRRHRVTTLRARGLSLTAIGRRLGISKQAVSVALQSQAREQQRSVHCCACGVAIVSAGAVPGDAGKALCLSCLDRYPEATFAQRLKAFRLAAGLTMAELDRRAGLVDSMTSNYERGDRNPRPARRAELARALGISVDRLSPPEKRPTP
jgi:transcriptional regulator with XRE-family HTH domain